MTHLLQLPGLIDCHVHFREPGMTEAEEMMSGAAAALAGGIMTVCDMPNTNPPTCTRAALEEKIALANRVKPVAIRFFFGVTKQEHLHELQDVILSSRSRGAKATVQAPRSGVSKDSIVGVKLYFDHSTGNQRATMDTIKEAFWICSSLDLPVVCHCEDAETNERAAATITRTDVAAHSLRRPPESEVRATEAAILLAKESGAALHIAHISTTGGVELVRQAKRDGMSVTCEAAPHHLFLSVDDYEQLGTLVKMNPPLRTRDHVEALWTAIDDRTIDCIATDHAPHTLAAKKNPDPLQAPSGVPGVETMLPLLLSCMQGGPKDAGGRTRGMGSLVPEDILRLCYTNPNRIFRLGLPEWQSPDKPGQTSDKPKNVLTIDLDEHWVIHAKDLKSKCGWTPYEGWEVRGRIVNSSFSMS